MVLLRFILFIHTLIHHDIMIFHTVLIVKGVYYSSLVKYGTIKFTIVYTEMSSILSFPCLDSLNLHQCRFCFPFWATPERAPMPDDAHSLMTLSICMPGEITDTGSGRSTGGAFVFDMSHFLFPCDVHM
jgi:hypothetical protein